MSGVLVPQPAVPCTPQAINQSKTCPHHLLEQRVTSLTGALPTWDRETLLEAFFSHHELQADFIRAGGPHPGGATLRLQPSTFEHHGLFEENVRYLRVNMFLVSRHDAKEVFIQGCERIIRECRSLGTLTIDLVNVNAGSKREIRKLVDFYAYWTSAHDERAQVTRVVWLNA